MKLLFCDECCDIFKLDYGERSCKCGKVTGRYVDNQNAVTNGKGFSLAIGNGSLMTALRKLMVMQSSGEEYDRSDYLELAGISCAWVRPNEGDGNPHTSVYKEKRG